jgi:hypothetical protein
VTAITQLDVAAIVARWRAWAISGYASAQIARHKGGDEFGAQLIEARREVRLQAVVLLLGSRDVRATATWMHKRAIELHVPPTSPFIGFDEVALKYTRARTWQACAWDLDPDLPEAQARWD